MIDILFNCFNSLNFYLILFIGFLLYLVNRKSKQDQLNKETEVCIDSIPRRSEDCPQKYPNGWLPVYDSHDLKRGQVKPIFALGHDLVIYRGTSGKVYVFDAYCPHLGANLGVGGTVVGDDIKCHFHGWQFNNQGDCASIPGLEDKSIPKATIRKWRCDEVMDIIYVWHHLEGKDPDWFIPIPDDFENFVYRGQYRVQTYCFIQEIFENEADQVHFEAIHGSNTFIPKFLQKIIDVKLSITPWKGCDPPNTHCCRIVLSVSCNIFGLTFARISADFLTIGPALHKTNFRLDIGLKTEFIVTFNCITLDHFKQLTIFKLYSEPSILGFIISKVMFKFLDLVVKPDITVWNSKRYRGSPQFTRLDEPIVQFRRWYKQFYSRHSKKD